MDFAFLYCTDQSKIFRIMVRQRNRRIQSGSEENVAKANFLNGGALARVFQASSTPVHPTTEEECVKCFPFLPDKCVNSIITSHFEFVYEEYSGKEIIASFDAIVFEKLRFQTVFRRLQLKFLQFDLKSVFVHDVLMMTVGLAVEVRLHFPM